MSDSGKGKASAYGQVSDSVQGKYDRYVPKLIDNTQVQQAKLKDMAIGNPFLLTSSNKNVVLPPVAALIELDLQLSERATKNVELGKRKIDKKAQRFHDSVSLLATRQESFQSNLTDIQAFLANISLVFVDSKADLNFLNPVVATSLGLDIDPSVVEPVTVTNGRLCYIKGVARNVSVRVQDYVFSSDIRLLSVLGCDLVLGAEWLESLGYIGWHFKHKIMEFQIDGTNYRLMGLRSPDTTTYPPSSPVVSPRGVLGHSVAFLLHAPPSQAGAQPTSPPIEQFLDTYQDLFTPPTGLPPLRPMDHRITLLPGTHLVNICPYRYAHAQKAELERQVEDMLAADVIRPSSSPFSSPALLVHKDDFFSKLDLRSGFHQIRMYEPDIPKTAFRTHTGHFEFLVMPFGLCNAPSTFQALMNSVFKQYLRQFVLVFFDDILVFSPTMETHLTHLVSVFEVLRIHHMKVKPSKCSFGQSSVAYLGDIISAAGVAVDSQKVQCILEWPHPRTLKGLCGFLGLVGYYRKFIRNFGILTRPLTDLLKKDNFKWNSTADKAFLDLKQALTSIPVLVLPDFTMPFTIECDASDVDLGAVLSQHHHPIAFLSKSLAEKHKALSV
nr:uncharacterized protein LOC103444746 [Malus domestica]